MSASFARLRCSRWPVPSRHRRRSRGFGLLEIILVFVLVIGAGAVVFDIFQSARSSAEADEAVEKVSALSASLHAGFTPGADYSPLGGGVVEIYGLYNTQAGASYLKPFYPLTGYVAKNAWGGQVTVNAFRDYFVFSGVNPNGMYMIELTNIPADVCPKLLAGLVGNGGNFYAVGISSNLYAGYGFISMNNAATAATEGYGNQMASPSFGSYAQVCQSQEDFVSAQPGGHMDVFVLGI